MKELPHGSLLPADSTKESFSKKTARFVLKKAIHTLPASVLIFAACSGGGGAENTNNAQELENKESGYALPFPEGETWFLTGGPHADGFSNGVRYAIDIAPPEVVNCTPGARITLDNRIVTASASGEVMLVGNDNDRNDPYHSVVDIKDKNGLTARYIHLDRIKVKKGDKVKQNQPLASPSCEYPPGGRNEGVHVHEGLEKDGQAIPIDGVEIGGWTVHVGLQNYDGTMTKPGEKTRIADIGRYGENSLGIRNDLPNNPNKAVVASPKDPIPPISGRINEKSTTPTTKPTEISKPAAENKISLSKKPEDLFRLLLITPIQQDELPSGITARGNSAGNLDATMQALRAIGQVNIAVHDSITNPDGGIPNGVISYNIFPDSSSAKAALDIIVGQGTDKKILPNFDYPTTMVTIPTLLSNTLVAIQIDKVTVITTLLGKDKPIQQTRAVQLAQAAIEHLGKVGK